MSVTCTGCKTAEDGARPRAPPAMRTVVGTMTRPDTSPRHHRAMATRTRDDPIPVEAFLAGCPVPLRGIVEALRETVGAAVPEAIEGVRPGWRLIGYDLPVGRRMAFFAFIWPEPEHAHIGFQHGVLMADPGHRLQGAGVTKQVRWLTFEPGDRVDREAIARLVVEAARLAGLTRAERLALAEDRSLAGRQA